MYCYNYKGSIIRREHVIIQEVRRLHVIGKPDVDKSYQGLAIKVNARESYDSPCSRSFLVDGRRDQNTVILRRMLTSADGEIIWRPPWMKISFSRLLSNRNGNSLPLSFNYGSFSHLQLTLQNPPCQQGLRSKAITKSYLYLLHSLYATSSTRKTSSSPTAVPSSSTIPTSPHLPRPLPPHRRSQL